MEAKQTEAQTQSYSRTYIYIYIYIYLSAHNQSFKSDVLDGFFLPIMGGSEGQSQLIFSSTEKVKPHFKYNMKEIQHLSCNVKQKPNSFAVKGGTMLWLSPASC